MNIKIEKGVPIPAPANKKLEYPFKQMVVGDSFVVEAPQTKDFLLFANAVASSCNYASKKGHGKFTHRRNVVARTVRVWRTA